MKADWEKRFNDSSLVIQFEYIGATGNYIMLKCKTCGEEFRRGRTLLTRTELHSCSCPKCKNNQFGFKGPIIAEPEYVQQIVDMYSAGIEQKEITETTGQSYFTVRYWLKKKGLYDPNRRQTGKVNRPDSNNRVNNAHKQEVENARVIRQTQEDAARAKKRKEYEKQLEIWRKVREERELEKERKIDELHTCPICHKTFTIREYAESAGIDPIRILNIEYCSDKCRHKGHKTGKHIERAKLHGCEWESGVTLSKLLKRDGLRCALCGELCDPNDTSWGNGSGPLYPSMDHKIPLAKGGTHTWDNVQVAHLICNSFKNIKFV